MATTSSVYIPLINGAGSMLVHGEIVRVSGVNTVVRAQADSGPHLLGLAGVNGSGSIGIGGNANIFTTGAQIDVLLETGLTPVAGQTIYVSATVAGRGTNVAPGTAVAIGVIENVTQYAASKLVQVALSIGAGGGVGAQGAQGAQGSVGAQGLQGATGSGAQGAQGFQGAAGSQGSQGTAGAQGLQGATGTGSQGAQGSQGTAGAQGSQGAQGGANTTATFTQAVAGHTIDVTVAAGDGLYQIELIATAAAAQTLVLLRVNGAALTTPKGQNIYALPASINEDSPSDGTVAWTTGAFNATTVTLIGFISVRSGTVCMFDTATFLTDGSIVEQARAVGKHNPAAGVTSLGIAFDVNIQVGSVIRATRIAS